MKTINILIMTYNNSFSRALALLVFISFSVSSYAQETTFTDVVFSGVFGGTFYDSGVYTNPTGSQSWGGFANEDASLYPLSFVDGGSITFTGSTPEMTATDVYFRFEYNPYPDTEPSFNTVPVTVSGDAGLYSIDIPSQGSNTFSSFLLYVTTQDVSVTLTDITVTASFSSSDVYGCTDATASNYDPDATIDDGSCVLPIATIEFIVDMNGVDQPSADYALVTVNGSWNGWNGFGAELFDEDGDGVYTGSLEIAPGTTFEYVVAVSGVADGYSGWGLQWGDGCLNTNVTVTAGEAGTVTTSTLTPGCADVLGCLDANASNYDANATAQAYDEYGNLGCVYASCDDIPEYGCIYADGFGAFNAEFNATQCESYGGTPCEAPVVGVEGCIDANASNYDANATTQAYDEYGNSSCVYASCDDIPEYGCIYPNGFGAFNETFSASDCVTYGGTPCEEPVVGVEGCLDANASNYDATATTQAYDQYGNLSCIYASCDDVPEYGCIYPDGFGAFNATFSAADCVTYGGTPCEEAVIVIGGCMYPNADNYNELANDDDGSCIFPGTSTCLGDLDGDNTAGTSDLLALLSTFGTVCE